jgi:hypothetical protein
MKRALFLAIVLGVLCIMACGGKTPTAPSGGSVTYKVSGIGTSSASLTYATAGGGTAQVSNATLPWSYTWTAKAGDFLYISAQNNASSGSVTVEIWKGSSLFQTTTSTGAYVIATASGSY